MARTAGVRVSSIKVDFDEMIVANYSSAHIMQLIRSAKQRAELKSVPFAGLDVLFSHAIDYLNRKPVCDCCGCQFERKADGKGGGGKRSLSFHRVIASLGYVPPNVRIICGECNVAIGEIQNMGDLSRRFNALTWQTKLMDGG